MLKGELSPEELDAYVDDARSEVLGETAELVVRAVHSSVLAVSPRSRPVR